MKRMPELKFYSRLDSGKADRDNLSTDPCWKSPPRAYVSKRGPEGSTEQATTIHPVFDSDLCDSDLVFL